MTQKAGTILINLDTKNVGLVYRKSQGDYTFPKGHLEPNETILECAVRETEEETQRSNHLASEEEAYMLTYTNTVDGDIEAHYYIAIDDGPTTKTIAESEKEVLKWIDFNKVEETLSYNDLKEMWRSVKDTVWNYLK